MLQNSTVIAGVITGGLTQLKDTGAYLKGEMDGKDYTIQTTENVTGAAGVMAGIEYGAMLGSMVFPGVGTVIGTVAGGLLGHQLGRRVGAQAGSLVVNSMNRMAKATQETIQDTIME
ncbi:hypothetical protein [Brevibacillus sp. SYSU BS000544]|uniref:hypothetical protein n=1 Tax=Brevibacillus sp. SYSU BS000544 TaxID=3416443 RepID=UPI003CE5364D